MATPIINEWRTWYAALVQLEGERVLKQCGERVPVEVMLALDGLHTKEAVTLEAPEPGTWQAVLFESETSDNPTWIWNFLYEQFEQVVIRPTDYSRVSVTLSDTEPEPPADAATSASVTFPADAASWGEVRIPYHVQHAWQQKLALGALHAKMLESMPIPGFSRKPPTLRQRIGEWFHSLWTRSKWRASAETTVVAGEPIEAGSLVSIGDNGKAYKCIDKDTED